SLDEPSKTVLPSLVSTVQRPSLASSALMVVTSPVFLFLMVSVLVFSSELTSSSSGFIRTASLAALNVGFSANWSIFFLANQVTLPSARKPMRMIPPQPMRTQPRGPRPFLAGGCVGAPGGGGGAG